MIRVVPTRVSPATQTRCVAMTNVSTDRTVKAASAMKILIVRAMKVVVTTIVDMALTVSGPLALQVLIVRLPRIAVTESARVTMIATMIPLQSLLLQWLHRSF